MEQEIRKNRISLKKLVALFMALVMLFGTIVIGGADSAYAFDIDSSGFSNPEITTTVVYYWHKGLPPTDKIYDKADLENMYPLLITWDDKYYFCADKQFWDYTQGSNSSTAALDWPYRLKYKDSYFNNDVVDLIDVGVWALVNPIAGIIAGISYLFEQNDTDYLDVDRGDSTAQMPSHVRHMNREYPMSENGLISNLKLDFQTLKKTGTAVSFAIPNLPMAVNAMAPEPLSDIYDKAYLNDDGTLRSDKISTLTKSAYGYDEKQYPWVEARGRYAIYIPNTGGRSSYKNYDYYPMVGWNSFYNRRIEVRQWYGGTKANYDCSWDWYLDMIPDYYNNKSSKWLDNFLKDVNMTGLQRGNHSGEGVDPRDISLEHRLWTIGKCSNGKYRIMTPSVFESVQTTWAPKINKEDIQSFIRNYLGDSRSAIQLMHRSSALFSTGWVGIDNMKDSLHWLNTKPNEYFDIYYGEPAIMNFLQTSFTVQNGQVSNLDGPIVIADGVTITVEDGGVLSTTDWIINNGTIVVEPGGTLLVQENTTDNDMTRYGVIAPLVDEGGLTGGRIICDGRMIVMPNCKVAGGGKYGLVFGEGAQCVNYGALISENFEVYADHTIENRGEDSIVVFGTSIGDSYPLLTLPVSRISDTFLRRESICSVKLAKDAVYGKGAGSVWYLESVSGHTVEYKTDLENKKGPATDNMPRLALKSSINVEEGAVIYRAGAERIPENELVTVNPRDKVQTYSGGDVVVFDSNQITKGEYKFGNDPIVAVNGYNEVIFSGLIERWNGKDSYAAPVAAEYTVGSAGRIYSESDLDEPLAEFASGARITVHEGKRVFIESGGTRELYRIADQDLLVLNDDGRVLWNGTLAGWDGVDPATISKYPAQYVSTADYSVYAREASEAEPGPEAETGGGAVMTLLTDIPEKAIITLNAFGECTVSYRAQAVKEIPEGETPSGETAEYNIEDFGGEVVTVETAIDGSKSVEICEKTENADGTIGMGAFVYSGEFRNWTPND